MGRLQNKIAIVTGAGSGIGKATVELFRRDPRFTRVVEILKPRPESWLFGLGF